MTQINRKTNFFVLTILSAVVFLTANFAVSAQLKSNAMWQPADRAKLGSRKQLGEISPKIAVYTLNRKSLNDVLAQAPLEFSQAARDAKVILEIPTPDGKTARFQIEESPMLAPNIAAQFPTWKTYQGKGIDDPTATARFDTNDLGFHAYVTGANGAFLIDPYSLTDQKNYIVYFKGDIVRKGGEFSCEWKPDSREKLQSDFFGWDKPQFSNGTQLRTYRLAISATKEYTDFFGGNVTTAFAAIQTTVNRINVVYRRELAVTFTLVSDTKTVFTSVKDSSGKYTNDGGFPDASDEKVADKSLTRNQAVLDDATILGSGKYDIGHVLSVTPNPNGLAQTPSLCDNRDKAQGFTGSNTPQGYGYDVDYVAHEIGHQFSMSHTFNNDIDGSCTTREPDSAYEPGSGITIMSYGGICAPRNIAQNSIEYFNLRSFDQALTYLDKIATSTDPNIPQTCGTPTNNNNAAPTVTTARNFTIPAVTPFTLTATATDANSGDALTYLWEEFDKGNGATGSAPKTTAPTDKNPNPVRNNTATDDDADGIERPLFRAYNPTATGSRTFPSLYYILNPMDNAPAGGNQPTPTYTGTLPFAPTNSQFGYVCKTGEICVRGEQLPTISRTMNFRVTVRDNNAAGGAIADAISTVTVVKTVSPFRVTAQDSATTNTTWQGGTTQTVTWDAAGTTAAPISAANVKISLSTDGGQTFPIVLANSVPNNGSATITVPNNPTATARIKVEAVGNIFFDINNANFTISQAAANGKRLFDFDGDGRADISVFRPSNGNWFIARSGDNGLSNAQFGLSTDLIAPADYDNDGKTDIAVFRPSNGNWFILNSSNNTVTGRQFGQNGDIPVPGDFDGNGKAELAVFRPSNGTWYYANTATSNPAQNFTAFQFGQNGDKPIVADFDGDKKTDFAVFRPSNGTWYVQQSTNGFTAAQFGLSTDIPTAADFDGDGKADFSVFRPSNGTWYQLNSGSNNQFAATQFGLNGDIPVAADYDGDNKADIAVFRPSNNTWYLLRSQQGFSAAPFGTIGDKPAPAAFNQ